MKRDPPTAAPATSAAITVSATGRDTPNNRDRSGGTLGTNDGRRSRAIAAALRPPGGRRRRAAGGGRAGGALLAVDRRLVARVEGEGVAERGGGGGAIAGPLERDPLVGPPLDRVHVAGDHHVEIFQRGHRLVHREVRLAARRERLGVVGGDRNRPREILDRGVVAAERLMDQTTVVIGARVVGI